MLTVASRSLLGLMNALAFGNTAMVQHEWRAYLALKGLLTAAPSDAEKLVLGAAGPPSPPPEARPSNIELTEQPPPSSPSGGMV